MQTDNRILDDLARIATGALGTLQGARGEVEALIRQQFERILADMELVERDEFEAVKAMAAAAREENEQLAERIAALEAALAGAAQPSKQPKLAKPLKAAKRRPRKTAAKDDDEAAEPES